MINQALGRDRRFGMALDDLWIPVANEYPRTNRMCGMGCRFPRLFTESYDLSPALRSVKYLLEFPE